MISAIERYFVTRSEFPWTTNSPALYPSADSAFPFVSATDLGVGICGTSTACPADGLLIVGDELKTEFRSRDFVKNNPTGAKRIMVGKAAGSSSSVYACYTPLSKTVRDKACTDGKVYTLGASTRSAPLSGAACISSAPAWGTGVNVVCVPE